MCFNISFLVSNTVGYIAIYCLYFNMIPTFKDELLCSVPCYHMLVSISLTVSPLFKYISKLATSYMPNLSENSVGYKKLYSILAKFIYVYGELHIMK